MSGPNECVAHYEYDGLFRRIGRTVTNQGIGVVHGSNTGGILGIRAGYRPATNERLVVTRK